MASSKSNAIVGRHLFRMIMRHARHFDKHQARKAVIPHPLPFSYQVLLGGFDRDFYYHNASVSDAVRSGFRQSQAVLGDGMNEDVRIELALKIQAQCNKWRHLLAPPERPDPFQLVEDSPPPLSYADVYPPERRQADPDLDASLRVLEEAQDKLGRGVDNAEVIRLYEESIKIKPTADAHTYLGFMLSYGGDLRGAIGECQTALKLDPEFGNTYNDLGLYYSQMGEIDQAIRFWEESKTKRRYDVRYKPYLNLGHLHLELGEPQKALSEYVMALHHAGPNKGSEIREVIADMARVLTEENEALQE